MSKYIFTKQHKGTAFYFDDYEDLIHFYVAIIKFAYDNGMDYSDDTVVAHAFHKALSNNDLTNDEKEVLYDEFDETIYWINDSTEPPLAIYDKGDCYIIDDWT